jgi:hypothetical protein
MIDVRRLIGPLEGFVFTMSAHEWRTVVLLFLCALLGCAVLGVFGLSEKTGYLHFSSNRVYVLPKLSVHIFR